MSDESMVEIDGRRTAAELEGTVYVERVATGPGPASAGPESRQPELWAVFYAGLWALIGERVSLTVEQRGHEFTFTGRVSVHADGCYSIGQDRFRPGDEGLLVRWASHAQVQTITRPYDWERDGECL